MRRIAPLFLVVTLAFINGCGKEAARIPFPAEGTAEATASLKAGDVGVWTDIDLEFEGDAVLAYKVDFVQNGTTVGTALCNPLGDMSVRTNWTSTDIMSRHSRRGSGKMRCDAKLAQGGATTVRATLAWAKKPTKVTLRKADLVVKQ